MRLSAPGLQRAAPRVDLATDLVDASELEIIEIGRDGHLSGPPRSRAGDPPAEAPYEASSRDPGSLAGLWEGLARS